MRSDLNKFINSDGLSDPEAINVKDKSTVAVIEGQVKQNHCDFSFFFNRYLQFDGFQTSNKAGEKNE